METIQTLTETKARKNHRCDFCTLQINKGDVYLNSVHKADNIYSWKSHIDCEKIAVKLEMYRNCDDGVTTNDFIETINYTYWNTGNDLKTTFAERLTYVIKNNLKQEIKE